MNKDHQAKTADLVITNVGLETETDPFSYYLNLVTESNIKSWSIKVNGVPMLQNSVRFSVPAIESVEKTFQLTLKVAFEGLELVVPGVLSNLSFHMTGICYEDIASPAQYAVQHPIKGPF